jgi:hypothetical protein
MVDSAAATTSTSIVNLCSVIDAGMLSHLIQHSGASAQRVILVYIERPRRCRHRANTSIRVGLRTEGKPQLTSHLSNDDAKSSVRPFKARQRIAKL